MHFSCIPLYFPAPLQQVPCRSLPPNAMPLGQMTTAACECPLLAFTPSSFSCLFQDGKRGLPHQCPPNLLGFTSPRPSQAVFSLCPASESRLGTAVLRPEASAPSEQRAPAGPAAPCRGLPRTFPMELHGQRTRSHSLQPGISDPSRQVEEEASTGGKQRQSGEGQMTEQSFGGSDPQSRCLAPWA